MTSITIIKNTFKPQWTRPNMTGYVIIWMEMGVHRRFLREKTEFGTCFRFRFINGLGIDKWVKLWVHIGFDPWT